MGRKGWREEKEDRKNANKGSKSNIELELPNSRYHRNCYRDIVNKLQINKQKSTYDHHTTTTTQVLIRHLQLCSEDHIKQRKQDMDNNRITCAN